MPQYAWMPLNKQDSEYAWCPKYAKVLYIGKFWMLQASEYAMVTQLFEYAIAEFQVYLGIYIYKDSEYERALNMQELHNVLIMPQYSWRCLKRT